MESTASDLGSQTLAPGVPPDYYRRIYEAENRHWWFDGMRSITESLLASRLAMRQQSVLDVGCGTGGFLTWADRTGSFDRLAGVDISSAGIALARTRIARAELHVCNAWELPFPDESFDLVATNDVLQHVPEDEIDGTLQEIRRVLRSSGTLFIRTNGARTLRRERADWRAYSRDALVASLEAAGFECERVSYANLVLSLWALTTLSSPRAPTEERHGIPLSPGPRWKAIVARRLLAAEARYLRKPTHSLPYGHTLFALARPRPVST